MAIVGLMGVTSKSVRLPVQKVQHGLAVATDLWFWTVCSGNALYPCARALFWTEQVQAGLLHHHRKSMNSKELRIRTWVNASDCPARSYAQSVAPGAVSSLLQATYVDQEKQRKSCPYKDLCLYC